MPDRKWSYYSDKANPALRDRQIVLREDLAWLIRAAREREMMREPGSFDELLELRAERDRLREELAMERGPFFGTSVWHTRLRTRDRILAEIERWADESYEVVDMDWHEWAKLALAEARRRVEEE